MTNAKVIICRECGEQIFFVRTATGAKMPVNKDQVGYTLGGKDRVVTPNGEVLAATITDRPETGIGFQPHWATCSGANRVRKAAPAPAPKKKRNPEASLF